jgi:hypothetical protein
VTEGEELEVGATLTGNVSAADKGRRWLRVTKRKKAGCGGNAAGLFLIPVTVLLDDRDRAARREGLGRSRGTRVGDVLPNRAGLAGRERAVTR